MTEKYSPTNPWVGFDLDGTLAFYDHYRGEEHIGEPIQPMIDVLKHYLNNNVTCKIMTARTFVKDQHKIIQDWLEKQGLPRLEVTNQKDWHMMKLYDDRAASVKINTGKYLDANL